MNSKEVNEKIKRGFKKFWFLLWKDNSLKGWLFSMIFLFVFIKFIFFPALSLVTGTALPLAIVESCSMYHQGNILSDFNEWFQKHDSKYSPLGISEDEFQKFNFNKGFSKGDILFILGANTDKLKVGDIITFKSGTRDTPIIHRIIEIKEQNGKRVFTTMGDNNAKILIPENNAGAVDEREIQEEQIVGKAVFRLAPALGWVKLIFLKVLDPNQKGDFAEKTKVKISGEI